MSISIVVRFACAVAIVVCITAQRTSVQAQQRSGTAETDKVEPVNSGPNPYRIIRDWAQLTLEKRPWGGSNGVAIDREASPFGQRTGARRELPRVASAPRQIRSISSTRRGRRSGALAAACSSGHTASTSIETETSG